jgi:hypothetical protein
MLRKIEGLVEAIEGTVKKPLHEARALDAGFRAGHRVPLLEPPANERTHLADKVVKLNQQRRLPSLCREPRLP